MEQFSQNVHNTQLARTKCEEKNEKTDKVAGFFTMLICLDKGVSTKFVLHDNSHRKHKLRGK